MGYVVDVSALARSVQTHAKNAVVKRDACARLATRCTTLAEHAEALLNRQSADSDPSALQLAARLIESIRSAESIVVDQQDARAVVLEGINGSAANDRLEEVHARLDRHHADLTSRLGSRRLASPSDGAATCAKGGDDATDVVEEGTMRAALDALREAVDADGARQSGHIKDKMSQLTTKQTDELRRLRKQMSDKDAEVERLRQSMLEVAAHLHRTRTVADHRFVVIPHDALKTLTNVNGDAQLIGVGSFGRVVKKTYIGQVVAVKQLGNKVEQVLDVFEREASLHTRLSHPNVVKLLGVTLYNPQNVEEEPEYQLVMELLDVSLRRVLSSPERASTLTAEDRMDITVGILSGLAYVHETGIVHSDVNADNILLTTARSPKLCDFGVSVVRQSLSATTTCQAKANASNTVPVSAHGFTLKYAAPEVVASNCVTTKSDAYAAGLVLLELWAGRIFPPSVSVDDVLCCEAIRCAIPAKTLSLIERLLANNPTTRMSCAEALATLLPVAASPAMLVPVAEEVSKPTTVLARRAVNDAACYAQALALDAQCAATWYNLGVCLGPDERVLVHHRDISRKEAYATAASLDPDMATAWHNLGVVLVNEGPDATACVGGGCCVDAVECSVRNVQLRPTEPSAWIALGKRLKNRGASPVVACGRSRTSQECFVEALSIDPRYPEAWVQLYHGWLASDAATVRIKGQPYGKTGCLREALNVEPSNGSVWLLLGLELRVATTTDAIVDEAATNAKAQQDEAMHCFSKAIQWAPTAFAWVQLGRLLANHLPDKSRTYPVCDVPRTCRDCYVAALTIDPKHYDAWFSLAFSMTGGEVVSVLGKAWSEIECYAEALSINASCPASWLNVGNALGYDGDDSGGNRPTELTVHGVKHTKQSCYEASLGCDPKRASIWLTLGRLTKICHTTAVVCGVRRTPIDCFVEALELELASCSAWFRLGEAMRSSGATTVVVQRRAYSATQCFAECIQLEPCGTHASTCFGNIAILLPSRDACAMVLGMPMTKRQCYVQALQRGLEEWTVWYNLGILMGASESVWIGAQAFTQRDCFAQALDMAGPTAAKAAVWDALGAMLSLESPSITVRGQAYGRLECHLEALACDPTGSGPWFHLGIVLSGSERISFAGKSYTSSECFAESLAIDPQQSAAWYNIGIALTAATGHRSAIAATAPDVLVVLDKARSAVDCFVEALRVNPAHAASWVHLAHVLNRDGLPGERVTISETHVDMSGVDCVLEALRLAPDASKAWRVLGNILAPGESVVVGGIEVTKEDCADRVESIES